MTRPHGGLEVLRHHRFLEVERGLAIGFFGLANSQSGPRAPLHELALRSQGHALARRALHVIVALGGLEGKISKVAWD